jgi:uncharacterized SAM-binding protein YcdF (DUF218 family)
VTSIDHTRPATDSDVWQAAAAIWAYHRLGHEPAAAEVIIALGCHDIGVADLAADLYHQRFAPLAVTTGVGSAQNRHLLADVEAVAFRARMIELGVPEAAVLAETSATNTGQNFTYSRDLLADEGCKPESILVACMPYMERRAFATCRAQWPDVEVRCASTGTSLADYLDLMWQRDQVPAAEIIANMVGDLDRIIAYPGLGFAIEQPVPSEVVSAFRLLIDAGYGSKRLQSDA